MWNISNIFNALLSNAHPGPFIQTDVPKPESSERTQKQIKKNSKELSSHPLTDLPQENLSSDQGKIDDSNMGNRIQSLRQYKNRQRQYENRRQNALKPTTHELLSPSSISPPNTRLGGGEELSQILVFTFAVVYIVYTGWQNIVGSSSRLKSASLKNKQTIKIYQSDKVEGSKVTFSTKLHANDLFVGDRWVVVKNVSVRTPTFEKIPIKRSQIVTITQLLEKDHFLKAEVTFDTENKEYFTRILKEEWEYLVPFRRLSNL